MLLLPVFTKSFSSQSQKYTHISQFVVFCCALLLLVQFREHSEYGLSQWETTLQCNGISLWPIPCMIPVFTHNLNGYFTAIGAIKRFPVGHWNSHICCISYVLGRRLHNGKNKRDALQIPHETTSLAFQSTDFYGLLRIITIWSVALKLICLVHIWTIAHCLLWSWYNTYQRQRCVISTVYRNKFRIIYYAISWSVSLGCLWPYLPPLGTYL